MKPFSELSLPAPLLKAVETLGYTSMTPIQAAALPSMLAGRDVRGQARTGSGKTAAFALALLTQLRSDEVSLQVLVLCPTRELADQVSKEIRALARFLPNVKVLSLCGGIPLRPQLASLSHEPHIVVGTPGRIQDLINRQALSLEGLSCVVLDEADRMLDMGFLEAVELILKRTPQARKTWLFSATYPDEIVALSGRFQNDPLAVAVDSPADDSVIEQRFFKTELSNKPAAVMALLRKYQADSCLIFCNTKIDVAKLTEFLRKQGVSALELSGDLDQRDREQTLVQFANGSCRVLVATDVAARGLDIKDLPLVLGYELPSDPDVQVHRIGRTGRAGAQGLALTLVSGREISRMDRIETPGGGPPSWSDLPSLGDDTKLPPPLMKTLIIDAGRKDKLRPGDILGALTGEAGLKASQIGKIEIFATRSYVAIDRRQFSKAWEALRSNKIKGRKIRVRKL